jgi:hypothetical protein
MEEWPKRWVFRAASLAVLSTFHNLPGVSDHEPDLERLLAGFSSAYNARRQRVLGRRSPDEVVREGLARDRGLANPGQRSPPDPCVLPKAMLVIKCAEDVSQPDS